MKKLYDETHVYQENDHRRILWYELDKTEDTIAFLFGQPEEYGVSFLIPSDYHPLAESILHAIQQDELEPAARKAHETHWIFYTHRVDGDAMGDHVRFTIMARLKGEEVHCDIQYSDFLFASALDEILKMKATIERVLTEGLRRHTKGATP